ncbi:alginate export family protein, partial [Desulfosarcina sp.]|nr:alginate export family protein [Desulfosarcina sp.]
DVRIWGSEDIATPTGVFGSTSGLDIYEAWFKLRVGEKSEFTIGRQAILLDDQRLVSGRNWNQYGLTYDALLYNFKTNGWNLNVAVSYNNTLANKVGMPYEDETIFNSTNRMKSFNFIHLKKKFNEHISASAIVIGSGFQKMNDQRIVYLTGTYGLWTGINVAGFDANVNVYYQNGAAQSGKEVNAYMFTLNPGYTISKFRIGVGIDYFSGDDANNSDYGTSERTFNRFYGAVYKYNGNMNYYTYIKGSTKNGGLMDLYPNLTFKATKKHIVSAYYHLFSLANSVKLGTEIVDDKNLGSEVDLIYTFKQSKELNIKAGISYYFTTESLEKIKGYGSGNIQSPYWGWVMLTFKPTLFTSK